MKEINSCEEYVIFELEKKREQVKRLTEACRNYIEVMDDVNRFLDIMKGDLIYAGGYHWRFVNREENSAAGQGLQGDS